MSSTLAGCIRYVRRSTGAERGAETFVLTHAADGGRTLRATSRIDDIRGGILRDVTASFDPTWRPLECFSRIAVGGLHEASTYIRVAGSTLQAFGSTRHGAPTEQHCEVPERFVLIAHPVVLDAWQFPAAYDPGSGGQQRWTVYDLSPGGEGYDVSLGWLHPNGGMRLAEHASQTTPAGTFDCQHFRIVSDRFEPIDVWVTGPSMLLVVMDWPGFDARYELTELRPW